MSARIPMERWGADHWSTLAYIECRVVDNHGYLDNRQMQPTGTHYPVRLKGYDPAKPETFIIGYGDWGCLEDMMAEGLVVSGPDANPTSTTGRLLYADAVMRARPPVRRPYEVNQVRLTEKGLAIAGQLRAHKGRGGNFANFVPESVGAAS